MGSGPGMYAIRSYDDRNPSYAHIVPTPGLVRILVVTLMSCSDIDGQLAANSFNYRE